MVLGVCHMSSKLCIELERDYNDRNDRPPLLKVFIDLAMTLRCFNAIFSLLNNSIF